MSEASKDVLNYRPTATLKRFHASNAMHRLLMGPFGSGKSSACVMEIMRRAHRQAPHNGVRKTRCIAIRNSYPELLSTTIETWKRWVPQCNITFGAPIVGRMKHIPVMRKGTHDGTFLDFEIYFVSLDKVQDLGKLLGLEFTFAWVNEARQIDEPIIDMLDRVGRYPPLVPDGGPTWKGIIMDTNPPHTRHWIYRTFEQESPPHGWEIYKQPPALLPAPGGGYRANPLAENVNHLPGGFGYYFDQLPKKTEEWIKVYVMGEYGNIFEGLPVYQRDYNDATHLAKNPLGVYRGLPLRLGMDFGLNPSVIAAQITPSGRLHILREWIGEYVGLRQLLTDVVKPALAREFSGMQVIATGDPAGAAKAQADSTAPNCFEICKEAGILSTPARTQDLVLRRQSVIDWLTRTIDGQPAFQLDPRCKILREGFMGGYRFAQIQVASVDTKYRDVPEKNYFSHPHDALQYLCLDAGLPVIPKSPARAAIPAKARRGSYT